MGYYSEVAIKLNGNAIKKMPEDVRKNIDELFECVKELEDGGKIYHAGSLKWYGSFEDVKTIEKFLFELDYEKDECFEFLRLGEDDDDTERRTNGEEYEMFVERSINYEYC